METTIAELRRENTRLAACEEFARELHRLHHNSEIRVRHASFDASSSSMDWPQQITWLAQELETSRNAQSATLQDLTKEKERRIEVEKEVCNALRDDFSEPSLSTEQSSAQCEYASGGKP